MPVDVALDDHADLLGDAAGRDVLGPDERDHPLQPERTEAVIATGSTPFGGEPPIPQGSIYVPSDLDLSLAVDYANGGPQSPTKTPVSFISMAHRPKPSTT